MTSKNLFFKLLVQDLIKKIWCPICIFIVDFLALEVVLLLRIEELLRYPGAYDYTVDRYLADVFLTPKSLFMTVLTIFTAVICGISGFTYLHSAKQLDTYHSMPVKRSKLFAARYTSGVLFYLVPLIFHVLVCMIIGFAKGGFSLHAVVNSIGYIGIMLVIFLLVYSISIIAVMLTGNLIMSLLAAGVLSIYSLILELLRDILYSTFYYTNISAYNPAFIAFTPIHMVVRLMEKTTEYSQDAEVFSYFCIFPYVWVLLISILIFSAISYILYRFRPSEAAGRAIAFRMTEPVIKTAVVLPTSLYCGLFFNALSSSEAFAWYLFGVIFGFLVSAIFTEIVFRMDIKCAFHHCGQLLFNAACVTLIVAIFKTDAMGYNTYVPSDSEIMDCSVSISGLMSTYSSSSQGVISAEKYRLDNLHISDNPSIMLLARKAAAQQLQHTDTSRYGVPEGTPEWQELYEKENHYRTISFGYHLHNGKSVYRKYNIDISDSESLQLLSDIYNDIDYKVNSHNLFTNGWNIAYETVSCMGKYEENSIKLDEIKQRKLLEAYQSDFLKLNLEDIMSSYPVATLEFIGGQIPNSSNRYRFFYSDYGYPVFPSFTTTISLLKEYGFDCMAECPVNKFDSVTVYDYASQGQDGQYPHLTYTDKKQIQAILDSGVQDDLISSFNRYMLLEDNYHIYLGNDNDNSYNSRLSFSVKKGQLPDFVLRDFANLEKE